MCLLYVDDALILLQSTTQQIAMLKMVFHIFHKLSGLKVNLHKSELLVTADQEGKAQYLAAIVVHCKMSNFSITYLDLPLSDRKLPKESYFNLIHQEEQKLSGWKADLLSIGGRLVLLNSVLTAKPLYYMSAFILPRWVIVKLDKIRRRFLWHGHRELQV
jgi:hypothetical protein